MVAITKLGHAGLIMGQELNSYRDRRVTLNLETSLTDSTGVKIKAVVVDLSRTGVRLQISEPLFVGETVDLEMGRSGYAKLQILWVTGFEAGGVFLDMQ